MTENFQWNKDSSLGYKTKNPHTIFKIFLIRRCSIENCTEQSMFTRVGAGEDSFLE